MALNPKEQQMYDKVLELTKQLNSNSVGNSKLKNSLKLSDEEFFEVRASLISKKIIFPGKGKGGSTRLSEVNPAIASEVTYDSIKRTLINFGEIDVTTKFPNITITEFSKCVERLRKEFKDNLIVDHERLNLKFRDISFLTQDSEKNNFLENFEEDFRKTSEPAELEALTLLKKHLSFEEIKTIADEFKVIIREIYKKSGQNQTGTGFVLLASLLMKYGYNLFQQFPELRKLMLKKLGLPSEMSPTRWKPGSLSSEEFIKNIGFPIQFAGELARTPESSIYFPSNSNLPPLRDFQEKALRQCLENLSKSGDRCILKMPTGTGKIRTAIETLVNWTSSRVSSKVLIIWVAHTEELCEQAVEQFRRVFDNRKDRSFSAEVFRFWGPFVKKNLDLNEQQYERLLSRKEGCSILITSNIMLERVLEEIEKVSWLRPLLIRSTPILVIDEAHRSGAETYVKAIDYLCRTNNQTMILGLTATPRRGPSNDIELEAEATKRLEKMFNNNVLDPFASEEEGYSAKSYLINQRILAKPYFRELITNYDLNAENIFLSKGEENLKELNSLLAIEDQIAENADAWERRKVVIDCIFDLSKDQNSKIIYFGANVHDSELVSWGLRMKGIRAVSLSANTPFPVRRKMIKEFRDGEVKVMSNCMILTTGFDDPKITHVVVGRPTLSTVLFEQMIGRGLRGPLFQGTDSCEIIYVLDKITKEVSNHFAYFKIKEDWELSLESMSPFDLTKTLLNLSKSSGFLNTRMIQSFFNVPDLACMQILKLIADTLGVKITTDGIDKFAQFNNEHIEIILLKGPELTKKVTLVVTVYNSAKAA